MTKPKPYIFFVLIFSLLFSSPVFAALEKSSKKACSICHVMWLEDFRTDNETLIEWQPGNVLMKDTQGVVSSEEICYSCHDGYVADSRHSVWKHNNHKTFVKPSENVRTPEELPLSNKDEIYCGTCHSPHGTGSAPLEDSGGPTSFFRLPNIDSGLCEMCHINEADYKRTKGHPIHTGDKPIPDKLFEMGSVKAQNKNSVTCQTCHKVHGAQGNKITVMDNTDSRLCMTCHEERSVEGTRHDLRTTLPDEKNMKNQSPSESGPCGACHMPHHAAGSKLWARGMNPGNPASQRCMTCHDKSPDDKIKDTGKHSHPVHVDISSEKGKKKIGPVATDKLPFFSDSGEHLKSGLLECATCHNVHQWDPLSAAVKGGKDEDGGASNSFLRVSNDQSSALCMECHQDKKQLLAYDHNLALTAPEEKNINQHTVLVSGPCGACHVPHNAADKPLWARKFSGDQDVTSRYCTGCHHKDGAAKEKPVGENDHPVNSESKGFNIASPGKVSKHLPLFNKKGGKESGNLIGCLTCHEPHAWGAAGTPIDQNISGRNQAGARNAEGDARNSFLRVSASPAPDLCVTCHQETEWLVGTDHDLSVTAPEAKNAMEQTVKESGQCGACHTVHNSQGKMLLWARAMGPVAENQHPMNALCTSCHSEGAAAEGKIPPVATHPQGQLISNIRTFDGSRKSYIPLFDSSGKEVNVGDMACSSCHSFYQWDHRAGKKGEHKNIEGDANTSFLRISSDKAVCIDCHGQEALWRHTYFHSTQKRKQFGREKQNQTNSFKMSF